MEAYKWLIGEAPTATNSKTVERVTILWSYSLMFNVIVVLLGTLCLQWLREYQADVYDRPTKEAIALRQLRHSGLIAWKVPAMVNFLPILVQLSVCFFLIGIMDILRLCNTTVTIAVGLPIGAILFFLTFTTIAPGLKSISSSGTRCPYRSPQARIYRWLMIQALRLWWWIRQSFGRSNVRENERSQPMSWLDEDIKLSKSEIPSDPSPGSPSTGPTRYLADAWLWARGRCCGTVQETYRLVHCLSDLDIPTLEYIILQSSKQQPYRDVVPGLSRKSLPIASNSQVRPKDFCSSVPTDVSYWSVEVGRVSSESLQREALLLRYFCDGHVPPTDEVCRFALELRMRLLQFSPSFIELFSDKDHSLNIYDEADVGVCTYVLGVGDSLAVYISHGKHIANAFAEQKHLYTNLIFQLFPDEALECNALGVPDYRMRISLPAQSCLFRRIKDWCFSDGNRNKLCLAGRMLICAQYLRSVDLHTRKKIAEEYIKFAMHLIRVSQEEPIKTVMAKAARSVLK